MTVSLANADKALKDVYLDTVRECIDNRTNPFLAMINKTSNDIWGKEVRMLVVHGSNGGIKAGTENDDLPISSGVDYDNFVLPLKNFYGTIEISDKAMRASANNSGAFVNLLNAEMESLIQSCRENFGRMLFGDGSGKLATIELVSFNGKFISVDSVKYLREGMIIDFVDPNDRQIITSVNNGFINRIKNVNKSTNTIELEDYYDEFLVSKLTKGSFITVQGSYNKELTGLEAIFDTEKGELYGLNKMDNKFLNPYIKIDQGNITEEDLQKGIDDIEERTGNTINIILCSFGVKRALQKLFNEKHINSDVIDVPAGYKALSYNGIPIVADRFCPEGTLYLLNTNDFAIHQLCDWTWLEGGDGTVLHQVPGKPVYTATVVKYADLLCSKPWGQGKISGIVEE